MKYSTEVSQWVLQLHKPLHRIRNGKARLGHSLPRLLRDLRERLHLAQLVRMFVKFSQNVIPLLRRCWWDVVLANSDDARHDRDYLRQILVQCWRWCRTSDPRKDALYRIDDGLCLGFEIRLTKSIWSVIAHHQADNQKP